MDDKAKLLDLLAGRTVRLTSSVDDEVELGFHFCYGDVGQHHFMQPPDLGQIVELALAVFAKLRRPVAWVHMPVPKDRDDEAYLGPLERLLPVLGSETDMYLGLVHEGDLEGTKRRMQTAEKVSGSRRFGISTEYGLGRRGEEQLESVLSIEREVVGL